MPSFKPVIRKNIINADGKTNIKICVIHKGKPAHIGTIYYIDPKYMGLNGKIKSSYPGHVSLNQDLMRIQVEYNNICADIGMQNIEMMSINDLVAQLKNKTGTGGDFLKYAEKRIAALRKQGRLSLADLYETTCKHLKTYNNSDALLFKEVTAIFLKGFEEWLKTNRNSSRNTIANYASNIRAIFYDAIDNDVIEQGLSPFRKYKIVRVKKRPRPIDITDLKRLLMAQPYLTPSEQREVDIFFLSLYLGGINLKDLLYLKPEDYVKDRVVYSRFKTKRDYSIKVFPEAAEIINRYAGKKYLLNFMDKKEAITPPARHGYEHRDILRNTNKLLKLAGEAVGIQTKLNTYVARYSFATIANSLGVSKDVIAHVLGHGENTMTDLYIDFNVAAADEAIRKVIDAVNG